MRKMEDLKWIMKQIREIKEEGELDEEQLQDFILGTFSVIATEYVLNLVSETDLEYEGDKFAELTHTSRVDYYKNVDEIKGGFRDLYPEIE